MKIRVNAADSFGGVALRDGRFGEPGNEYDVPDEEGAVLCSEGLAEPIAEPDKAVETRGEPAAADVRAWAKEQGIDVAAKGTIPADVVEQYKAAQGGAA